MATQSAVTSLAFHPTLPLLLSSGQSATVYLHHIKQAAEDSNPLMLSVHVKNTPLHTTVFHPDPADGRIFLGGRRRFFHVWDPAKGIVEKVARVYGHQAEQKSMERFAISPSGAHLALVGSTRANSGIINILDGSTLQWVCQLRVESHGGVSDFAWWPDSSGLSAAGKDGVVTEWSLVERRTVGRWTDEGAVGTTTLALGGSLHADGARGFPAAGAQAQLGGHRWVAIGSSAGIVNVYDRRQWMAQTAHRDTSTGNSLDDVSVSIPASPKPVRTLDQLTTPVSHLHFSPDGQLLVMATRWKKGGLRLVHLPSCTVYRNWPTSNTPLGRISSVAWSEMHLAEKDGMARSPSASEPSLLLAVGSENGKIRLWQLVA